MALPTYAEALTQINTYIVANGNNEITANVLNPILESILDFANNNIGDLDTLTTDEKNSIVEAINSLKQNFDNLVNNGVQLYTGIDNPNDTPPPTYNYADFYMQLDVDSLPVKLWQWNGFEWTDESGEPATESDNVINNSSVTGATVTDALNNIQTEIDGLVIPSSTDDITNDSSVSGATATDALNTLNTGKENISNKATDFTIVNDTLYPSVEAVKEYADALLVGVINLRGLWDASANLFPTTGGSGTSGAVRKGDLWYVSVAGVLAGKNVNVGDSFFALVNTPGQTASNWNVLEANIGYVPANDANVIHTTGNETKTGKLTIENIQISSNPIGSTPNSISQIMGGNDSWSIFGEASIINQGIMVFQVDDDGAPHASGGQKFEFRYGSFSSGVAKTPVIIDYNKTTIDSDLNLINETASTIASFDASKNIKSLPLTTYPSLSELAYLKGVTSAIQAQLNSKQAALTNPITGIGISGYLSKFSGTSSLNNSNIYDDGTNIGIGTSTPTSAKLQLTSVSATMPLGYFYNPNTSPGTSRGIIIEGGTNSSDYSADFKDSSGVSALRIKGDRLVQLGTLAGTGVRQVVADSSGNLSATDVAPTSGTYTPTLTNTANVTSTALDKISYIRIGNVVMVTFGLATNVTAGSSSSQITMSLPITKTGNGTNKLLGNFTGHEQAGVTYYGGYVQELVSTTEVRLYFYPSASGTNQLTGTFTYTL